MAWHDITTQHSTAQRSTGTWHDMTWHDIAWYHMAWHDIRWHDITGTWGIRHKLFPLISIFSNKNSLQAIFVKPRRFSENLSENSFFVFVSVGWPRGLTFLCSDDTYYMACSASGQDESNPTVWFTTRAGKMLSYLPARNYPPVPRETFSQKP